MFSSLLPDLYRFPFRSSRATWAVTPAAPARSGHGLLSTEFHERAPLRAHRGLRSAVIKIATVSAPRMHVYIGGRPEIRPIYSESLRITGSIVAGTACAAVAGRM